MIFENTNTNRFNIGKRNHRPEWRTRLTLCRLISRDRNKFARFYSKRYCFYTKNYVHRKKCFWTLNRPPTTKFSTTILSRGSTSHSPFFSTIENQNLKFLTYFVYVWKISNIFKVVRFSKSFGKKI